MAEIGNSIDKAIFFLKKGFPIGMPTETVYGLATNGLDIKSIAQVFEIKQRPSFNPLIYHVNEWSQIKDFLHPLSTPFQAIVTELMMKFCPGPLTFLIPCKSNIPSLGRANLPRIAVRFPSHPMTRAVLERIDFPIVAPSANPFGMVSPSTAQHVESLLGDKIPYILDGDACTIGIESTIVGWENEKLIVYRKGGTCLEDIKKVTSIFDVKDHSSSNPSSPGQLSIHYAPKIPLFLGDIEQNLIQQNDLKKIGILSFKNTYPTIPLNHQKILSKTGNLKEAAVNLFAHLHAFHSMDINIILAELVPDFGLGIAINDRLTRASHKLK